MRLARRGSATPKRRATVQHHGAGGRAPRAAAPSAGSGFAPRRAPRSGVGHSSRQSSQSRVGAAAEDDGREHAVDLSAFAMILRSGLGCLMRAAAANGNGTAAEAADVLLSASVLPRRAGGMARQGIRVWIASPRAVTIRARRPLAYA